MTQLFPSQQLPNLRSADSREINHAIEFLSELYASDLRQLRGPDAEEYDERDEEYERKFSLRWLTHLISRLYIESPDSPLLNQASSLLAICSGTSAAGCHVRPFRFKLHNGSSFSVNIQDASINSSSVEGSVSVGVQTWGSASILSQLIASSPESYLPTTPRRPFRVLELGAGTGLVSLATANVIEAHGVLGDAELVVSDHDTAVIENLNSNVTRNGPFIPSITLITQKLDWRSYLPSPDPSSALALSATANDSLINPDGTKPQPYDLILGADVVYEPHQAFWLYCTVKSLLRRPASDALLSSHTSPLNSTRTKSPIALGQIASDARFHLVMPLRPTHEKETASVRSTFPSLADVTAHKLSPSSDARTDAYMKQPRLKLVTIMEEEIEPEDQRQTTKYLHFEIGWAYA